MKRMFNERRQASGLHPDGPIFKERRKAYYHGKYSKQMCSLLILVSIIAMVVVRQGA